MNYADKALNPIKLDIAMLCDKMPQDIERIEFEHFHTERRKNQRKQAKLQGLNLSILKS